MNCLLAIVRTNFMKVALPKHKFNFCLDVKSVSTKTTHNDTVTTNSIKSLLENCFVQIKTKIFFYRVQD